MRVSEPRAIVDAYHRETKHGLQGYAPSPGFLDWDSQPDPFRRFSGAAMVALPLGNGAGGCRYDDLYDAPAGGPAAFARDTLGLFLELSLGLSAWKSAGPDRWALRNNPSSGNLHPTEGYLLVWRAADQGLVPGLYHYAPHDHALERRAVLPRQTAAQLAAAMPGSLGALGLSSIIWREEWKYGARALRYCQHDVGHALAAARFAARIVGWRLRVDTRAGDAQVAACLGLDRTGDFAGAEPEHPDLLAVLADGDVAAAPDWEAIAAALCGWTGQANRLSQERVHWPQIVRVLPAVVKPKTEAAAMPPAPPAGAVVPPRPLDAATIVRRRRSAQRMDGRSAISFADFERALARTLPGHCRAPLDVFPFSPALDLLLFVHAVEGIPPGLYLLCRRTWRLAALRNACASPGLAFDPVTNTDLPLYRLRTGDERRLASTLCCHQGIAGRGAFAVGMIADLARVLDEEGPWAYRRLHWEAGLIGQILYLEAEAAGLRGTGIGCFFDDEVHELLGLPAGGGWQTLYHFTVGGAMADERLGLEPAYAHLGDRMPNASS